MLFIKNNLLPQHWTATWPTCYPPNPRRRHSSKEQVSFVFTIRPGKHVARTLSFRSWFNQAQWKLFPTVIFRWDGSTKEWREDGWRHKVLEGWVYIWFWPWSLSWSAFRRWGATPIERVCVWWSWIGFVLRYIWRAFCSMKPFPAWSFPRHTFFYVHGSGIGDSVVFLHLWEMTFRRRTGKWLSFIFQGWVTCWIGYNC